MSVEVDTEGLSFKKIAYNALVDARVLFKLYAPVALPLEDTEIITGRSYSFRSVGNSEGYAGYNGSVGRIHYIEISPEFEGNYTELTFSLVHELSHQKHAEIMGATYWHDIPPITAEGIDSMLSTRKPLDILLYVNSLGATKPKFTDVLSEGFAFITERIVFERMLREVVETGEQSKRLDELTQYYYFMDSSLLDSPGEDLDDGHHREGFSLAHRLMRWLGGFENFVAFLHQVDYEKTNNLVRGEEDFSRVLRYPSRIPLLRGRFPTRTVR